MLLPSALSPPTSRDSITAGGGPWQRTIPSLPGAGRRNVGAGEVSGFEGGDGGASGGPEARVDRGGGRRLAGSFPTRRGERPPSAPEGRGGAEGRADQEAQAEGRRAGPRFGCAEGGHQGPPFCPEDVGRVRAVLPQASQRRVCQVLAVARSAVRRPRLVDRGGAERVNEHLVTRLTALIQHHPTFGYRRLWAMLRFRDGLRITHALYAGAARHHRALLPQPEGGICLAA